MSESLLYKPTKVFPPGYTLREVLEDNNITQTELAKRMGRPLKTINEIIMGRAELTPETSLQLETVLDIPAYFWNNLESAYREAMARERERDFVLENEVYLKFIPIKEMIQKKWIRKFPTTYDQIKEVLNFFRFTKLSELFNYWETKLVMYKQSKAYDEKTGALYSWLRRGEFKALEIECNKHNASNFKNCLSEVRKLSLIHQPSDFIPQMQKLSAANGVAVVFLPELKGCRASGATYWLNKDKAMMLLSARYLSNDHVWFSFFHEAAHILLHSKKQFFVEGLSKDQTSVFEIEADEFAANTLINKNDYSEFIKQPITRSSIIDFSRRNEIAPGILVGRLQHDRVIEYYEYRDLKVSYKWTN